MSVPSLSAILSAAMRPRHYMFLHWLAALVLALAGLLGSGMAQAAVYFFDGTPVDSCTYTAQDKTYACPDPAYLEWNDAVVIAGGYTLKVGASVTVTYNQGLTMQPGAKLIVMGNLNIKGVNPDNLKIAAGSSIEVANTFSMGGQKQTVSGDISANAMHLGSNQVTINGNLTSKTSIAIGSHASIKGNISAAVVTTNSPVTITGDVKATQSFTLASGSKVVGNVDTGSLVLESSEALIRGSAWVDTARLEWHGRVAGTIYCKGGTVQGTCDCVTNNSGYSVNSASGPRCEAVPPAGVLKYRITHDGQASSCATEAVTVTACANADCTAPHVASAPGVTLKPGGAAVSFGGSGIAQASVTSIQSGTLTLGLAEAVPVDCRHSGTGSPSCAMSFADKTVFEILAPDHRAGEVQAPTLQALKPSPDKQACVPAFRNREVDVAFSCTHVSPSSGRDHLYLAKKGESTETSSATLACGGMAGSPTSRKVKVGFDANGKGALDLRYPDVGSVLLKASYAEDGASIEGEGKFTAVPYSFGLAATKPSEGFVAGVPFELKLSSLNKAGAITRGFDADLYPANATAVALDSCTLAPFRKGSVSPAGAAGFQDGVATVKVSWSEVGDMGLSAGMTGFLGAGIGSSGSSGDCKHLGPFVPAYLQVDRDLASPVRNFDYSGEPIHVVVSARNQQGAVTKNYEDATKRSEDVTLAAAVSAGGPGAWSATQAVIAAKSFTEGKAASSGTYVVGKNVKPAAITILATGASASSKKEKGEDLKTEVRLGRLRLGGRFGSHKATLSMPVTAEYWTGKSWLLNSDDNHTLVPQGAFAFKGSAGMKPASTFAANEPLKIKGGAAAFDLRLEEGGPGPVDIAINLRNGKYDDACIGKDIGTEMASTGANLPWLRPFTTGCDPAQPRDPYGRATFGVYTPENRRIIHVREVFN